MKIDWSKVKEGITLQDVLKEENKELKQEIERLNNIINELEKILKECMQHYDCLYEELEEKEALDIYYIYKYVFDKLKELKGNNNNE